MSELSEWSAPWLLPTLLGVYVVTSLTIPFWVPIVKRITGHSGVFWV